METNKIILGFSGGPDSTFLLQKLVSENKEVIAAHVNYHLRKESDEEEKLVKIFCKEKNVKVFVKDVSEKDWKKYAYLKNKQAIAREIRYDFYLQLAKKHKCDYIYIAHHKDDFIETALMQEKKSKDYLFYGLKKENYYKGFILKRPLLKIYKKDIIDFLIKNEIKFANDKTNLLPIYTRNIIRSNLKKKTFEEKEVIYDNFVQINKTKENIRKKVKIYFEELIKNNYSWELFNNIPLKYKKYVLYNIFISWNTRININSQKLNASVNFLKNKNLNKQYRLMKNVFLTVNQGKITLLNK